MSTEINTDEIHCPACEATLLAEGLQDVPVQCANCDAVFIPSGRRTRQRTSRKAIASLVLGLGSMFGLFVTGIPAVLLGVSAFRDIRRSPRSLRGKPLAVAGAASGAVFGLLCGTCVGVIVYFSIFPPSPPSEIEDPNRVAEIAATIADFEAPRGSDPLAAIEMHMAGMRVVIYGREPRADHPVMILVQYPQGTLRQQVELQLREAMRDRDGRRGTLTNIETSELELTIRGQPVTVTRTLRSDPTRGDRFFEYIAEIPIEGRLTLAALITPEEAGDAGAALSEDEVREFLESFEMPDQ